MTASDETLCCPVCGARFRQSAQCPRCGADLSPLMSLAAEAFRLRRAAREALQAGDLQRCRTLSARARKLHATERGRRLHDLTAALGPIRVPRPPNVST